MTAEPARDTTNDIAATSAPGPETCPSLCVERSHPGREHDPAQDGCYCWQLCEMGPTCPNANAGLNRGVLTVGEVVALGNAVITDAAGRAIGFDHSVVERIIADRLAAHTSHQHERLAAVEKLTRWAVPLGYVGGPAGSKAVVGVVRLDELNAALAGSPERCPSCHGSGWLKTPPMPDVALLPRRKCNP